MTAQTVTLRLVADGDQLIGELKTTRQQLGGLGADGQRAGQQAGRGMRDAERGARGFGSQIENLKRQAVGLGAAFLSFRGVQRLSGITDEYAAITAQTKLATQTQQDFAAARREIFEISQDTSTQLSSTAELFARASRSTRELGIEQERILGITETINQSFAVSQTATTARANAITQLTQAFAGGVLRAEEFNSVIENAPRLAEALADGMGVGIGELRRQVNDGEVTVSRMIAALEDQADEIEAEFAGMSLTIGRGWVQIGNAITRYIGSADQARGASTQVAESMSSVADKMDLIGESVINIGFGVLAVGAGRATVAIQGKIAALTASIAATNASNLAEDAAALTALRKAQADNSAAISALNLARAEANLARGANAQTIALNNQLAAMQRAATARGALNAATAAYTATTRRATLATRIFSTAIGALGGPLGIAVTGLTALFFWTQRNKSIADDMEPTVRTVRELADEAARLRNGGGLLSEEQTNAIAKAREEINRAAQAIGILHEQRERALGRGNEGVAQELTREINALLSGIEDRSDAIRTIQDAFKDAGESAGAFGGELNKTEQELAILDRQLELMRDGVDASTAALRAQIEAATGTERAILEARLQISQLQETAKNSAAPLGDMREEMRGLNSERIESLFDSAFVANLSEAEQKTFELQRQATDLRELYARTGDNRFLEELEAVEAKMGAVGDEAAALTDELRRTFETRFGTEISDGLVTTLSEIEQVRNALGDIDTPFQGSIDRMLAGLQTFNVAADKSGSEAAQLFTAGTAQMLGGVQQLASQGSSAYEKLGVAVQALHGVTAIQAVLNQGAAGDPFSAVARMVAMAGIVTGLGVSIGSISGGGGSASVSSNSTGTGGGTFGDIGGVTESIANSVEITANASEALVGINTNMLRSLQGLQQNIGGFSRLLVRQGDIGRTDGLSGPAFGSGATQAASLFSGSLILPGGDLLAAGELLNINDLVSNVIGDLLGDTAGGIADVLLGGLNDLLGGVISSVAGGLLGGEQEVRRRGVEVIGGSVQELLDDVFVRGFARIRTSRGLRGPDYRTEFTELPDVMEQQFNLVLQSVVDSAVSTAQALGVDQAMIDRALSEVEIDTTQIRTDQSGEKIEEELNALFSTVLDDLAGSMAGFLDEFVRFGEGLFETGTRVATNIQATQVVLERLGGTVSTAADFGLFSNSARLDPEQLARLSTAFVDSAGGVEALAQASSSFVDDFLSQERQLANQRRELESALEGLGLALPDSREGFVDMVQQFRITDEASARTVAELLRLAPALDKVFSAAEKTAANALDVRRAFGLAASEFDETLRDLGIRTLPTSESGMRQLIESLSEADQAALQPFISDLRGFISVADGAAGAVRDLAREASERATLEIRLAQALGDESRALALQRESELLSTTAANRALLQQIFSAEDAARAQRELAQAQDEAARAAEARRAASLDVLRAFDLAPSAFEAVVESMGLVTAELPRTADAMGRFLLTLSDAQRAALQPYISELQGLTSTQPAAPATTAGGSTYAWMASGGTRSLPTAANDSFESELRNAFQRESAALEQQIARYGELSDGLQRFARSLSATNDEFGNTARLQAEYERQIELALAGNQEALSDLPGVAEALTRQLRATATNELELRRGIARIQADSVAAAEIAGNEASLVELQLESMRDQVSALISIEDAVRTVAEILSGEVSSGQALRFAGAPGRVLEAAAPVRPAPPVVRSDERLLREIAALRREVSELRAENDSALRAVAAHTADAARSARDINDRHELWDADGLPPERTAA